MKAPIPSPFETPPQPAKSSSQVLNHLIMAGVALLCFGAMWLLSLTVGVTPVGIAVISVYYVWAVAGILRVKGTGDAIGWNVTPEALPRIRETISFNMKGAYAIMVSMWPFLLLAALRGQMLWFLPIMIFSVPFSFWSMSVEGRFKKMPVVPEAESEWMQLLTSWKEPRFGLKK